MPLRKFGQEAIALKYVEDLPGWHIYVVAYLFQ